MATPDASISAIKETLEQVRSGKAQLEDQINTISYVKSNNDISIWSDGTAIGSKWSESVDNLINTTTGEIIPNLDGLISATETFLSEQTSTNNNG